MIDVTVFGAFATDVVDVYPVSPIVGYGIGDTKRRVSTPNVTNKRDLVRTATDQS